MSVVTSNIPKSPMPHNIIQMFNCRSNNSLKKEYVLDKLMRFKHRLNMFRGETFT